MFDTDLDVFCSKIRAALMVIIVWDACFDLFVISATFELMSRPGHIGIALIGYPMFHSPLLCRLH